MSDELKDVEFYAANLNAWLNTKFELDKSLLTLSAGGVGLLITLVSTVGVRSIESLILYLFALICFIVCLASLLLIFRGNAKHLEDVVNGRFESDPFLNVLDRTAAISFMLGVILASIIGVSTAVNSYIEKEKEMADKKSLLGGEISFHDSMNNISNLRPKIREDASVDGISNMRPSKSTPIPIPTENKSKDPSKK